MKTINILLLTALLSGCMSIPVSSLWKLRNFDPLESDLSSIQIAVITDKTVSLNNNSTNLILGFTSTHPEYSFTDTFYATIKENTNIFQLEQDKETNEHIILFYFNEETTQKIRMAQNRLREIKDKNIKGNGSLSVNINTGCFHGPKPEKLIVTTYVRFNLDQGYIKLNSATDLLAESEKSNEKFWVKCSSIDLD